MKGGPQFATYSSPIGPLTLLMDARALAGLWMEPRAPQPRREWVRDPGAVAHVFRQLDAYFAGELARFDVPLALKGTAFQMRVWTALCEIPFGSTVTYSELAARLNSPASSRAVGFANARNPISIVVPCHRVIGRSGQLTGYAGGLERKRWLLAHEMHVTQLASMGSSRVQGAPSP